MADGRKYTAPITPEEAGLTDIEVHDDTIAVIGEPTATWALDGERTDRLRIEALRAASRVVAGLLQSGVLSEADAKTLASDPSTTIMAEQFAKWLEE